MAGHPFKSKRADALRFKTPSRFNVGFPFNTTSCMEVYQSWQHNTAIFLLVDDSIRLADEKRASPLKGNRICDKRIRNKKEEKNNRSRINWNPRGRTGPKKKGKSIHTSRVRRRRRRRKDGTEITTDYYPRKNNIKTQNRKKKIRETQSSSSLKSSTCFTPRQKE